MDIELTMAQYGLTYHSTRDGHVICKDGTSWAVIEPTGNVHFGLNSLAVARAWIEA